LSTPKALKTEIQLGSIFPRIFPGLPAGEDFEGARKWFEGKGRGWVFKDEESIDLYRNVEGVEDVTKEVEGLMEKATGNGISFGVSKEGDDEGLLEMQERDFGSFTVSLLIRGWRLSANTWCRVGLIFSPHS
jgi:beta-N-acetylhexosaminidase